MSVVALTNDLLSRTRAESPVAGVRAIVLALEESNLVEQRRLAAALGVSERSLLKARRVVREEPALAVRVREGELSLDAAELVLRDRSMRSVGPDALLRLERRIAAESGQAPRRALAIATAERDEGLSPRDVYHLARHLNVNNTAMRRARQVVATGADAAIRAGTRSLTDVAGTVAALEPPVRVDAAWVGREVSKKLSTALEALGELPLASDVAVLLREHSSLTVERLDHAINWLQELRRAF